MSTYKLLLFIFIFTFSFKVRSQEGNEIPFSPNYKKSLMSPTAASLGVFGEIPVSLYTGIPSINIPLFNVTSRILELPISLSYHAGGNKVDEIGGWVGLGWALNAGGVITRAVKGGVPDERSNGYINTGYHTKDNWPRYENGYEPDENYMRMVVEGNWDSQPDLFYFNFAGNSGRFVFKPSPTKIIIIPHQKMRINYSTDDKGISEWQITVSDGTKYIFSTAELTYDNPMTSGEDVSVYNSSWFLTSIVSSSKTDTIKFTYTTPRLITHDWRISKDKYVREGPGPTDLIPKDRVTNGQSQTYEVFLESINTAKYKVLFNISLREDGREPSTNVRQENKLDSISVFSKEGNSSLKLIKSFHFNYSYMGSNERLRLDSLYERSFSGAPLPAYNFVYNSINLPPRSSNDIDHWGYYNNAGNGQYIIPPDADRSPNPTVMGAGMLKEIVYPTGGKTEFIFEANDYGWISDKEATVKQKVQKTETASSEYPEGTVEKTVNVNNDQVATIDYSIFWYEGNGIEGFAEVKLIDSLNNTVWEKGYSSIGNESGVESIFLSAGQYNLFANTLLPNERATIKLSWEDTLTTSTKKSTAGGMRVKKITSYAKDSDTNPKIVEYIYTTSVDPDRSSGVLINEPVYEKGVGYFSGSYGQVSYTHYTSNTMLPLKGTGGSPIGYDEVTVLHGDNGVLGNEKHEFLSAKDYPDRHIQTYPFSDGISYDWKRGKPTSEKYFNQDGTLFKEKLYEYYFDDENISKVKTDTSYSMMVVAIGSYYASFGGGDPAFQHYIYDWLDNDIYASWTYPKKETTIEYDANGENPISSTMEYEYGDTTHFQLTKTIFTTSDNKKVVKKISYANEKYPQMVSNDNFMYSQRAQVTTYETTDDVPDSARFSTVVTYRDWGGLRWGTDKNYVWDNVGGGALPDFNAWTYGQTPTSGEWVLSSEIEVRDSYHNPLQIKNGKGTAIAIHWGYNSSLPVAVVENSSYEGNYFDNFEEGGNWDFSTSNVDLVSTPVHSGENACRLQKNGSNDIYFMKTLYNLDVGETYIFSVMVKGKGGFFDSRTLGSGGNWADSRSSRSNSSSWKLYTWERVANTSQMEIYFKIDGETTDNEVYCDDFRFSPSNSLSKTYTFHSRFQTLSNVTDENGNTIHYQFDDMGRLQNIQNNSNDTLSSFSYYYSRNNQSSYNPLNPNSVTSKMYFGNGKTNISKAFFDGLGRNIQNQVNGDNEYIISAIDYDKMGRAFKNWMPYSWNTGLNYTDKYDDGNGVSGSAGEYYDGSPGVNVYDFAYTETKFRNAFSNEIKETGFPGTTYNIGSGHTVRNEFGTNTTAMFGFSANTLFKTQTYDESGNLSEELKDVFGNTIGKRVSENGGNWVNTGFEYDILGNLVKVHHPLEVSNDADSYLGNGQTTSYNYNTLGQLIAKVTPDLDANGDGDPLNETLSSPDVRYKYDANGNLRFSQDANRMQKGQVLFSSYDAFDRVTKSGVASISSWNSLDANATYSFETDSAIVISSYDGADAYSGAQNLKGRVSRIKYKTGSGWGYVWYSYTPEGWVEWMVTDVYNVGQKKTEYEYDLQGNIIKMVYDRNGNDSFFQWQIYDALGRLSKVKVNTTNSEPAQAKAVYSYWPGGQVKKLSLNEQGNGGFMEVLDYKYNERNWLTSINAPSNIYDASNNGNSFGMRLYYGSGSGSTFTPQYNGNIAAAEYYTKRDGYSEDNATGSFYHRYEYGYDALSRIKNANYYYDSGAIWESAGNPFKLYNINYDNMGNFQTLSRNNESGTSKTYNYNYYSGSSRLKNTDGSGSDYTYDANGNVTSDVNKGVSRVDYDYRNLPTRVTFTNGDIIEYAYNHEGNRVYKKYTPAGSAYASSGSYYIYDAQGRTLAVYDLDGQLKFINLYGLDLIGKIF